jgi:Protein of unknown function (DUF4238)
MSDKQHYIPVCYLRGFSQNYPANLASSRDDLKIFVYDSEKKILKQKGAHNICQINKFYDIKDENGNEDKSIDDFFKETESLYIKTTSGLFTKYYVNRERNGLPFEDLELKKVFSRFILNQFKRVPKFIEGMKKQFDEKYAPVSDFIGDRQDFFNKTMATIGEGQIDPEFKPGVQYILEKKWSLFVIIDDNKKFVTSDNPVVLLGSDGLANAETEIVFPINEKMLIHMHSQNPYQPLEIISSKHPKLNHAFIREINMKIAVESFRYIMCSNEYLLRSLIFDYELSKQGVGLRKYRII